MHARLKHYRLIAALLAVLGGLACADTGCDCVTPLAQPMADENKIFDGVQMRLTPDAFGFIESRLPDILSSFLPTGLTFDIPRMDDSFCVTIIWEICYDFTICRDGCTISADIASTQITPRAPNIIDLDAVLNIDGAITLHGDLDFSCTVPLHAHDKNVHATVLLPVDIRDDLMTFDVQDVQLEITDDDYSFDNCDLWIFPFDGLLNFLRGLITPTLNSQIQNQLDSTLSDQLDAARCLDCGFYTDGCPDPSSCAGDYCEQDGTCRTKPLGMVGTADMGELMADFSPGMQAELDLFLALGQEQDSVSDPVVVGDGVELRMIGGADSPRNVCVPEPPVEEQPSNDTPPRLAFGDGVPSSGEPFMAGIGVSDAFLDFALYKAYRSGLLCLSIGSQTTEILSSSMLSALLGSLDTLTMGRNTPVRLDLIPLHVPYVEIGAGTFTTDEDGERVIDDPLLHVFMPGVALDFFVLVDERWVRVVTLTQDISLSLALDFTPENEIVPLFSEESIQLDNIHASNYELLAEDPSVLENLVPTLIGFALPMLTGALEPIAMPAVEGFVLEIVSVEGVMPRAESEYFEYLGLYANLDLGPTGTRRATRARLVEIRSPPRSRMSLFAPGGPALPEIELDCGTASGAPAEYQWRVDRGFWSTFRRGPRVVVRDARLALLGRHTLEVRARTPGDYRSLDPEPLRLEVEIAPSVDDPPVFDPPPTEAVLDLRARLDGRQGEQALRAADGEQADDEPVRIGCGAAAPGSPAGLLLLGLIGLGRLRRRRA
ncbi:MAG: hypothetical protein JXR96_17245 [Deltaproteobacteria bacterium]|nr:hypothetical protein [Deltaproteobacteria bacterium]